MRGSIRARIAMWVRERLGLDALLLVLALALMPALAGAEDGYDLWLRYRPMEQSASDQYRPHAAAIVATSGLPTMRAAVAELQNGLGGLLSREIPLLKDVDRAGTIVVGTPQSSENVAQ